MLTALNESWKAMPPPAIALAQIGAVLGIKPPKPSPRPLGKPQRTEDILSEVAAMGMPIMHGRPDDPMLELLDL